jgi:Spy/CpxP family protein refolding chaperone
MKARTYIATALAVALLAVPGFIVAQVQDGGGPGFGPGAHGPMGMYQRLLHRLGDFIGLTDEQRAEIEGIVEAQTPAIRELAKEMARARREFNEGFDPDTFNADDVRDFATAQAPDYIELTVLTAQLKADVYGVLTLEQREKLEELQASFGPRGGRRGPGGPGGHRGPGGQGGPGGGQDFSFGNPGNTS